MPPYNKYRSPKCDAYYKSDHNKTVAKLKCIWSKYIDYEKKIKITSSFGIFKTIYHDGSYLLLFGKRKLQNCGIPCE